MTRCVELQGFHPADDFNASLMNRLCSHPILVSRLACVIVIAALLGCQSPGPQLRSKADFDTYSRLSAEEREAVDAGVLRKGMTPETVWLAWGRPTGKRMLVAAE
jgi:hypothetical protein